MTAVTRWFFTPLYQPRSAWSILGWWERRRPLYNAAVGGAGLCSLAAIWTFGALPPAPVFGLGVPLVAVVAYGVLANLFYCLGPVGDVAARRLFGDRGDAVGPVLFRYGFVFAVGLSLLPVPMAAIGWVFKLVKFLL